jgi:ATP-binding cassette subfamily C exporter for protease/lipase/ATP-binding cassette subfamily C protein EexD
MPLYVGICFLFHPLIGAAALVGAVILIGLTLLSEVRARAPSRRTATAAGARNALAEAARRNAEVLQALGMTQSLLKGWRALQNRIASAQTTASRSSIAFTATSKMLRQAVQVLMMALGAYLVLTQQASAGVMIATTVLLGRAVAPVEQLVGSWRMLIDARAAYRRLLELSKDFEQEEPRLAIPRPEGRVAVENMSYRVRGSDTPILSAIALSLAPGEALAVIGPSAAGKSTLARLLTGVWAPTVGSVRLDGADVSYWPREQLGPWIGYVPQDVELFDASVAANIARLAEVESEAVVAAARRANAHEMILTLPQGYDTPVGEHGSRLSPGQRQRVALARALYGDPRLVVLDEPNSNLDGAGEIALAQALSGLRKEGVTSVVVTHRPSLIAHVDKILVLAAGRIQQFGPAGQVMKAMQQQAQALVGEKAA